MFEFLNQLNDNQVALLGCAGAVGASLLLLTISYHGQNGQRIAGQEQRDQRKKKPQDDQNSSRRAA